MDVGFPLILEPFSERGPAWHVFLRQHWGSIVPLQLWIKAEILGKSCNFLYICCFFYIDLFPSTHGTGIICVSSCIYRWSLSQRGYKLSSSWEVFIYKQKSCFKQSVRGNVTGLSLSIISEKGWRKDNWVVLQKWRKHKDKSACLQVCLIGEGCWHPCAIRGRSWHLDRAHRDGGWRIMYHKIWEMVEDAAEFADLCDGWHTGEKKERDCKRKHTTLLKPVELTFIARLWGYIYN